MEALYGALAAPAPAPAAVTAAAVSARLGLALLIKALEVVGRRKNFSGDRDALRASIEHATQESAKLAQAADEDIHADPEQRREGVPMKAARAAESGLRLCEQARSIVTGAIAADLEAAVILLRAGRSAIYACVRSNLNGL